MATKKKSLQAAAGSASGGEPVFVDQIFSTYLYTGNGSTQTITNGIDLSTEGGMVWIKERTRSSTAHSLFDTVRGRGSWLSSSSTSAASSVPADKAITSFNSDGFSLGPSYYGTENSTDQAIASWTFRKAPKFFDVVTWTGTGSPQTISHNLGSTPGMIIVKRTSGTESGGIAGWWVCYHRGLSTPQSGAVFLNSTDGRNAASVWNNTLPTDTEFTVNNNYVNFSGDEYVAYLFAHNDGDGEFGEDEDQDIIKCGSYTGDGTTNFTNSIDVGFEPQWLLIKRTDAAQAWFLLDNMRGLGRGTGGVYLSPNDADADAALNIVGLDPTGFSLGSVASVNTSGASYIYIAIRRPHKPAESGTEVFAIDQGDDTGATNPPQFISGFPIDMAFQKPTGGGNGRLSSRLIQGKGLYPDLTNAEATETKFTFDYMDGWQNDNQNSTIYSWMFKRATGFFDVVCYEGGMTTTVTIGATTYGRVNHNLGVTPELIIVKNRGETDNWVVASSLLGEGTFGKTLALNTTGAASQSGWFPLYEEQTENYITVNTSSNGATGFTGENYIAYLFASQAGISKVFSVTKSSGSNADVNCGFSSGARFVMLKRTDSTGDWYVWDTERGIVSGNDPYLLLNSTAAENTSTDYIDPLSTGFTIVDGGLANGDYIGLAIA